MIDSTETAFSARKPPAEAASCKAGDTLGGYELDRLVSCTAMGRVYEAHHVSLGKRVAIKLPPMDQEDCPEVLESLRNEARVLAKVQHPNVVRVLDFDEGAQGPFLVMEYLQGETLAARMSRTGLLPYEEALRIVSELAAALIEVHARGVVHCDLKPTNVFVVPNSVGPDSVKLLDFGISVEVHGEPLDEEPAPLSPRGTPSYMAPEQAWGSAPVDSRADQFSLAVMAYELFAGKRACEETGRGTLLTLMNDRLASIATAAPWLPSGFDLVLQRATSFRPGDRYEDVQSFVRALEDAACESDDSSDPMTVPPESCIRSTARATAAGSELHADASLCA